MHEAVSGAPGFSLVVATRGRTEEMKRLVDSLSEQTCTDFEVIVVDQNEDDRLVAILAAAACRDRVRHLRCPAGVSRARNMGMDYARGSIIGFPDDDCWYPPHTLENVTSWFRSNPEYDILSLNSLDENGTRSSNRWYQDSCDINLLNVYRTSVGYAYFVRASGPAGRVRYDEGVGPGADSPYLGGEDTDYILESMRRGARGRFEAEWYIGHPLKYIRNASVSRERVFIYGRGMGFVQRKHCLVWLWLLFLGFDVLRAAIDAITGRRKQAILRYWHARGLLNGFFRS